MFYCSSSSLRGICFLVNMVNTPRISRKILVASLVLRLGIEEKSLKFTCRISRSRLVKETRKRKVVN